MAFIPDEAIRRMREISPPAFELYAYYCMKRSSKTKDYEVPNVKAASETGIDRAQIYRLRRALVERGWIAEDGDRIKPLVGYFGPADKKTDEAEAAEQRRSGDAQSPKPAATTPRPKPEPIQELEEEPVTVSHQEDEAKPLEAALVVTVSNQNGAAQNGRSVTVSHGFGDCQQPNGDCQSPHIRNTSPNQPFTSPEETAFADAQAGGDDAATTKRRKQRKEPQERKPDPLFEVFAAAFLDHYGVPFGHCGGDFVQLANLRNLLGGDVPADDWDRAVLHYFASPMGRHTLADLCVRYASFRLHPLDKFKNPVVVSRALSTVVNGVDYGGFGQTSKTAKNPDAIREFSEEMERRIQDEARRVH